MTETKAPELTHVPGSSYPEELVQQGIHALALWNGRPQKASEALAEQGIEIPSSTLHRWRDHTYPERYAQVSKSVQDKIWAKTSDRWRGVVEEAADGAREAVELTRQAMQNPQGVSMAKDFSATAKNLALAGGIANDKAATIDGRPTEIHESRGMTEILRGLGARFPGLVSIDSTATEVTPDVSDAPPDAPSPGTHREEANVRELEAGKHNPSPSRSQDR